MNETDFEPVDAMDHVFADLLAEMINWTYERDVGNHQERVVKPLRAQWIGRWRNARQDIEALQAQPGTPPGANPAGQSSPTPTVTPSHS